MACKAPGRLHSGIVSELITSEKIAAAARLSTGFFGPATVQNFGGLSLKTEGSAAVWMALMLLLVSRRVRGAKGSVGVLCVRV